MKVGWAVVVAAWISFTSSSLAWAKEPDLRLVDAVRTQQRQRIRDLLNQDIDVDAAQNDGMTALHWAAYHDDVETSRLLVAAGADVEVLNRYEVPPLSIACRNGGAAIVELLLRAKANPNVRLPGGETALMTAARTGRVKPVQALLAAGADVNAKETRGQTAIMWAAAEGNLDVLNALMEAGGDWGESLKSGFTAFFFAVREGRTRVTLRLIEAGADVNQVMRPEKANGKGPQSGASALILAVENGHFELASELLEAGANPNDDRVGYTALHAVTWVRKPIRGDGDPPPIGSGTMSSLDFVRAIVARGANVNARHRDHKPRRGRLNRTNATPFLLAAESADLPLMRLLVELGADPSLTNSDRCTPLLAAAGVGVLSDGDEAAGTEDEAIDAIKLLLKWDADVNAVDSHGNTAMHGAAFKSYAKMVPFLAESGADVNTWNTKNEWRLSPLLIARGHRLGNFRPSPQTAAALEQVLRKSGVDPNGPVNQKSNRR